MERRWRGLSRSAYAENEQASSQAFGCAIVDVVTHEPVPTLYEWAGGTEAFRRLIEAFYDRVERDDLLARLFPGGVSEAHRAHVTLWWAEVFGGPARYTGEHGGYETMLAHHRGLNITPGPAVPLR